MFPSIFALISKKDCHPLLPTGALADWQEQNSHDVPLSSQLEQSNDEDIPEMTSSYLLVSSYDQICVALRLHLYDSLLSLHPMHTKLRSRAISCTGFTKILQDLCLKPVS